MGAACTPGLVVPSPTGSKSQSGNGKSSWGGNKQTLSRAADKLDEVNFEEAGDTPIMYPTGGVQQDCLDCLGCCKRPPPPETGQDFKPFYSTVAIVRHGERLDQMDPAAWFNSDMGRAYPFDCPLTANGRKMAREVAEELQNSGTNFALVVSSPYVRCVQTAAEMCQVLGLPMCIDAELSEIYGPRTHGKWKRPPPKRSMQEISKLVTLAGTPLLESRFFVRNDDEDFFGCEPEWPETLEDARLRLVSRAEQYLARGLQLRRNFILVTHGDCVAASLGLLLSSQMGPRRVVTKIQYCAYCVAERAVDEANPVPLGLADDSAGWELRFGNCQVSELDDGTGDGPWKGPYDPLPLPEEAERLKQYEEEQLKEHKRKLLRKTSTTVLKSALHRQKSKTLLDSMQAFDVQFGELVPEDDAEKKEFSDSKDVANLFISGGKKGKK
mmetsp:Transcript_67195/g.123750  ORF Transcript_67195/g.123750 Transcript_67195/m.123750 type:complete len:440 (-) Transcript_67195:133-1452(-)